MNELLGKKLGEYVVVEEIGRGSVATVFKAHQPSRDRYVALKILPPYFAHDAEIATRFREEAAIMASLDHPNIVPLYDYGIDDGLAYLVVELMEGKSLKDEIGEALDLDLAASILSQLASALDYASARGVLHRNIKPTNIFLHDGTARLSDFAICMDIEGPQSFTKSGVFLPAAEYTSPELAEGYNIDSRSDIYSLGIFLYQMVTGELPFTAYTPFNVLIKQINRTPALPSSIDPTLPIGVDDVIMRALAKNPRDRYSSAEEMAADFRQAIESGRKEPAEYRPVGAVATRVAGELRSDGAAVAVAELPKSKLICPACGAPQQENSRYCRRCWVLLVSEDELEGRRDLSITGRVKDWLRYHKLVTAIVVIVVIYLLWNGQGMLDAALPRDLPPPTSNITATLAADSWPSARGNLPQTAYVENVAKAPAGKLKWSFPIGTPANSSPVVAAGKVFVGSSDGKVYAIDAGTGQLKWTYKATGPVDSTPAVAGNYVYVGLRDGRLLALDINTGEEKWEFKAKNPIYSAANVADGVVYIGTADSNLYAVDAVTGAKRWEFKAGSWIDGSPAVADGMVAVGSRDGYLYVLDAATGEKRFQYQVGGWVEQSPVIYNGLVYVGANDGRMRAVDPKVKASPLEPLRYFWVNFYVWGIPIPPPPPPPGFVWAFRPKGTITSAPALAFGKTYFGASDGRLYAVKIEDGSQAWEFKTGDRVTSSPVVGGDTLYVGSEDGKVYALDANSGAKRWEFGTKGRVTTSPALVGGVIYIGSSDGYLYALE